MLTIQHPESYLPEREYIFRVVFGEMLGIDYTTLVADGEAVCIAWTGSGRTLRIADVLFQTPASEWLSASSMPCEPLARVKPPALVANASPVPDELPVVYGRRTGVDQWISVTDDAIDLGIDVFGSAFFMLTRYEEAVLTNTERHGRFPTSASLAFREGALHRPLVDEYVELLRSCLAHLFPGIRFRRHRASVSMTFDVDWPAIAFNVPPATVVRASIADVMKRRQPSLAVKRLVSYAHVQRGAVEKDAGNIFDAIMDSCEHYSLQATFFFQTGDGEDEVDGTYGLDHPWIQALMSRINDRGHMLGLHPSYRTYRDPVRTRREANRLRAVAEDLGIKQTSWGGRQHYLRWEAPATWQNYEDADLQFDSTLGFADETGFRCGTSHQFPVFNVQSRRALNLHERPLLAMDAAMFSDPSKGGLALDPQTAVNRIADLHEQCRRHGGNLVLLWHNNWLLRNDVRAAFDRSLERITKAGSAVARNTENRSSTEAARW